MGVSALRVVTTKNVVHAALYLVLVLAGVVAVKLGEHHPAGYGGDRGDDDAFDPTDRPQLTARPAAA